MAEPLRAAYDAMPEPRLVAALGDCALGCGVLGDRAELAGPLEDVLPVDIRIPGCPPTPQRDRRAPARRPERASWRDGRRSRAPAAARLEAHVACMWTSHDRAARVLPDACADIVFVGGRMIVAGPATEAIDATPTPGQGRCGVRFRVGSAGAALGLPVIELLDLGMRWRSCGARGATAGGPRGRPRRRSSAALAALTRGWPSGCPAAGGDPLVRGAAVALVRDGASLPKAGRTVGLGERQLRRRFERAVGYGPATLVRDPALPALPRARRAAAAARR